VIDSDDYDSDDENAENILPSVVMIGFTNWKNTREKYEKHQKSHHCSPRSNRPSLLTECSAQFPSEVQSTVRTESPAAKG